MTIHEWINEYGLYHKNKTNKIIHWICIPIIMFSLFGLLDLIPYKSNMDFAFSTLESWTNFKFDINILTIFIILSILFYLRLSITLSLGMISFSIFLIYILKQLNNIYFISEYKLLFYLLLFITAWIGQFIGHAIEGKKPAFFKDLQFLLIGPLWLLSFIYKKIGIRL